MQTTMQGLCSGGLCFPGRTPIPRQAPRSNRLVVRAEGEEKKGGAVAKVDRTKDTLFFASDQSLSYLDGSLPADYGFGRLQHFALPPCALKHCLRCCYILYS